MFIYVDLDLHHFLIQMIRSISQSLILVKHYQIFSFLKKFMLAKYIKAAELPDCIYTFIVVK